MRINEKIKKCVAFLQYEMADKSKIFAGTCFFVSKDAQNNRYRYAVTAKHVIEGIKKLGIQNVIIKMNLKNGTTNDFSIKIDDWTYHENAEVDIAIHPFYFSDEADHVYYPESAFLNAERIRTDEIECGDEVFITGLFKHHHGESKNLPIVRIGNLAMMANEKVQVKDSRIDAHLIESRSIGGLSGSPVFVNLGTVRRLE